MQISKNKSDTQKQRLSWFAFYQVLLSITVVLVWFSQQSINFYWQQTYHQDSPLVALDRFNWWQAGAELQQKFNQQYQEVVTWLDDEESHSLETKEPALLSQEPVLQTKPLVPRAEKSNSEFNVNDDVESEPKIFNQEEDRTSKDSEISDLHVSNFQQQNTQQNKAVQEIVSNDHQNQSNVVVSASGSESQQDSTTQQESKLQTKQSEQSLSQQKIAKVEYTELQAGNKVLFAGDSLMQGLAPQLQKLLKRKFGINSINLSKQSTGLSYPHFFDWPATIEQTLQKDPKIKLLIVMLGPNDPWNMPNPANKRGAYLKFKSPEWEEVYRQRIQQIIHSAEQHQVQLIWIEVPFMRKNKLNQQTRYLNQLYADEMKEYGIWVPLERYLSGGEDHFTDTLHLDQKNIRVRTKDGIHFTLAGGRYIADYILQYIHYL